MEGDMAELDYRKYWDAGFTWGDYLEREVKEHRELWHQVWERSKVPAWAAEEAARLGGEWKLLVISEDWCGDASNTVPVMARLAEQLPGFEMRVVKRDENPELMDEYLTSGSRSIPLAVILRGDFTPVGQWGPRPAALQEFVLREKKAAARAMPEIYRDVRTWYARDRGETTVREILAVIDASPERAAA
jgi:Thioredoxin